MRIRAKICGITRVEDAEAAARHGADAIGLVFYRSSPRYIDGEQAQAIVRALPPFVTRVGLFVNADAAMIRKVMKMVPLDLLQFHGDEPPEVCRGFGHPYIKAIAMQENVDLIAQAKRYKDAAGLLFDTYVPGEAGGTGCSFDWEKIPTEIDKPIIIAGGLTPENVGEAIRVVRPYAVDVSSGVEQSKGIKDAAKIAAFLQEVNKHS